MIKNIPIRIIIYLYWNTDELVDLPTSYMNIVYKVTLAKKIKVEFETPIPAGKKGAKIVDTDKGP